MIPLTTCAWRPGCGHVDVKVWGRRQTAVPPVPEPRQEGVKGRDGATEMGPRAEPMGEKIRGFRSPEPHPPGWPQGKGVSAENEIEKG